MFVNFLSNAHLSVTMEPTMVISTYPDRDTISKVAKNLVNEQLCACVNIIEISSIYRWEGKIEDTSEYMAIFKTTSTNRSALKERIAKTHPYDVPEIAELDVLSLNDSYLKWLSESS